jgi:hypothetical protein
VRRSDEQEARELLTLFAYHGDEVRVAQALGVSPAQLSRRVKELHLTNRVKEVVKGGGEFVRAKTGGARGPIVRRKGAPVFEPPRPEETPLPSRTRVAAIVRDSRGDLAAAAKVLALAPEEMQRALEEHRLTAVAGKLRREHLLFLIGKKRGAVDEELVAEIERAGLKPKLDAEQARRRAEELKPRAAWARARQIAARRGYLEAIGALAGAAADLRAQVTALGVAGDDGAVRRALRLRRGDLRRLRDLL